MKPIMNKKGLFALVCALMGMTFSAAVLSL